MKSMTGFGRGTTQFAGHEISVELSAVNRRTLETSFSLPKEWQPLERTLADQIRKYVKRGKVHTSIRVGMASAVSGALSWDDAAVADTLTRLQALAERTGVAWQLNNELLLKLVSLHQTESSWPAVDAVQECVVQAMETALHQLEVMRVMEGQALARDTQNRILLMRQARTAIVELSSEAVPNYREQLFQRLRQAGLELDLQDERVLKELAIFADRSDIAEELTRLDSHLVQLEEVVSQDGDESIGRKLEFILQEINREVNTIGSKTNLLPVTRQVIECKNEIERIREQVQNVE